VACWGLETSLRLTFNFTTTVISGAEFNRVIFGLRPNQFFCYHPSLAIPKANSVACGTAETSLCLQKREQQKKNTCRGVRGLHTMIVIDGVI
jgi:hypothetical protein